MSLSDVFSEVQLSHGAVPDDYSWSPRHIEWYCVLCNRYASREHCLSDMHVRNVQWYGAAANQRRQRAFQRMGIGQQQPQQQQQQPQQAWHRSLSNNTHRRRSRACSRAPAQQVVAGIHAATQQQPQQQQQQPQLLPWPAALQGVDGDPWAPWALVDQMPEPTPAMVQELGNFIESLKFPAFHWRHLFSAHNRHTGPMWSASPPLSLSVSSPIIHHPSSVVPLRLKQRFAPC